MKYHPRDVDSIKAVMAKSNVVINLIGVFNLVHNYIYCILLFMIKSYFDFVYSVSTGREYETRNYSFEEVNHHMAEQLATVCPVHFTSCFRSAI
jgi:NADH dehydrogenase (ubiquinone) 1 alpha subcomplex subunit 9